jgi:hypothetical protein
MFIPDYTTYEDGTRRKFEIKSEDNIFYFRENGFYAYKIENCLTLYMDIVSIQTILWNT